MTEKLRDVISTVHDTSLDVAAPKTPLALSEAGAAPGVKDNFDDEFENF